MIGTLFSLLLGIYLYFTPEQYSFPFSPDFASVTMMVVASGVMLGIPIIFVSAYFPLLKAEEKLTPRLLEIFSGDRKIRLYTGWLLIFAIFSYVLAMVDLPKSFLDERLMFSIWIIMLGISTDMILKLTKKIFSFLSPFEVVDMFAEQAKENVREDKNVELFHCIDGLTEIALKSVQLQSSSLSCHVTDELDKILQVFLESSASIGHYDPEITSGAKEGSDKVSYALFYTFQRIEMIFNKALQNHNEPLCNHIIQVMGKIMIHAAKCDITLAGDPLHYIGKFVQKAIREGMLDVGDMTSCTLQEVARIIMEDIDITYLEIKDVYVGIVNYLDEIAKETFRHDKNISIPFLMLPFKKLEVLFSQEKAKVHQDTPVILQNIKRVLLEFETLQTVMQSIPAMPQGKANDSTEKSADSQQEK